MKALFSVLSCYNDAASVCVYPEFYQGIVQPGKGALTRAGPGSPLWNVPHPWVLIEHLLDTRSCVRRRTGTRTHRACFLGPHFAEGEAFTGLMDSHEGGPMVYSQDPCHLLLEWTSIPSSPCSAATFSKRPTLFLNYGTSHPFMLLYPFFHICIC